MIVSVKYETDRDTMTRIPESITDFEAAKQWVRDNWNRCRMLAFGRPTQVAIDGRTIYRSRVDLGAIHEGHYAVDGKRYHVNFGRHGKWEGWLFLTTGSDYHERKTLAMVSPDGRINRGATGDSRQVLATINNDPVAAMAAYGIITGTCGRCGRKLEDPASRAAGIGPICQGKML